MKMIRAMFLLLAVCLPTSWTLAHAEDAPPPAADAKPKKKKGKKKKEEGDMGDKKMEK
ncbi:MAG TPA: hypothetical protein VHJ20_15770 [Polyangia bacterium]|nr:hypothetical protein [Polyangia bacterium]